MTLDPRCRWCGLRVPERDLENGRCYRCHQKFRASPLSEPNEMPTVEITVEYQTTDSFQGKTHVVADGIFTGYDYPLAEAAFKRTVRDAPRAGTVVMIVDVPGHAPRIQKAAIKPWEIPGDEKGLLSPLERPAFCAACDGLTLCKRDHSDGSPCPGICVVCDGSGYAK